MGHNPAMSNVAFTTVISRELEGMRRLAAVLAEEFASLGSTDPDALDKVLQRKAGILDELQHCAAERATALRQAGIAADGSAIQAWVAATAGPAGAALWADLMARTREVWVQHQTNTALLEGLMRHNRQSLDLLTRLANPEMTYQADGSTAGGFGTRSRGSA